MHGAGEEQQSGEQLDRRVLEADGRLALAAAAAQQRVAEQRHVLPRRQLVLAMRAVRRLDHDPGRRGLVGFGQRQHLAGVLLPLPLQQRRQAQDHHVEEAADQQPDRGRAGGERDRVGADGVDQPEIEHPGVRSWRRA
jgi:hypothetical protein